MPGQRMARRGDLSKKSSHQHACQIWDAQMLIRIKSINCHAAAQTWLAGYSRKRKSATYSNCFSGPYAQYLAASTWPTPQKHSTTHMMDFHWGQAMLQVQIKWGDHPLHPQTHSFSKQRGLPHAELGPVVCATRHHLHSTPAKTGLLGQLGRLEGPCLAQGSRNA